jgi:hypothetical protein
VLVEAGGGPAEPLFEAELFDEELLEGEEPFEPDEPLPVETYCTEGAVGAGCTTTRRVIFFTMITRRPGEGAADVAVAGFGDRVSEANGAANAAPPAIHAKARRAPFESRRRRFATSVIL